MFQLFLRARAQNFLRARARNGDFEARSADRDIETDRSRVEAVVRALDAALSAAEGEKAGLARRVDDALASAAIIGGNDTDEYLIREPHTSQQLKLFGAEISNGQRRLQELAVTVGHFKFLKAALHSRFPDYKMVDSKNKLLSAS
jgi:hypothetical protein